MQVIRDRESMSAPMAKEMEFTEHHLGGGEEVSGEIGGEIYIPVESSGTNAEDSGTLDEPVTTTLVSCVQWLPIATHRCASGTESCHCYLFPNHAIVIWY